MLRPYQPELTKETGRSSVLLGTLVIKLGNLA
jgi:hypothetical protein